MDTTLSSRWKIGLPGLLLLLAAWACGSQPTNEPEPTLTPTPPALIVEADIVYGPGPFTLSDAAANLGELSSYKASLSLSFTGTSAGQPDNWSKVYVMLVTKEPPARQLTIEKTGDFTDLDAVFLAEAQGVLYERRGENACAGNALVAGDLAEVWEPAAFLSGVGGAEEAGSETINSVPSDHYTFDERALGQASLMQASGELWVATEGGYVVRYLLTMQAGTDYFGEGVEGTLTWDYELTDVNQPVTISLPDDCPPGLVQAPLLPDASHVNNAPGLMTYTTSTSPADAAAFYQQQLTDLAWTSMGAPAVRETDIVLGFFQGDQTLTVILTAGEAGTDVLITLSHILR